MAALRRNEGVHKAAIIGGGPAGLMAAEVLIRGGVEVNLYDAMPSVGRKLLMAGRGGLNLTHSEPYDQFILRYGKRLAQIKPMLDAFGPDELIEWVHELGIDTFVGSSGRVFPTAMKASPLLRAWLSRLGTAGVKFHVRHRWLGWADDRVLRFETPAGEVLVQAEAVVLALGGGSWAKLGSTGAWVPVLQEKGVRVAPLMPTNCGFDVGWSPFFREQFAGTPVKSVALNFVGEDGNSFGQRGEFVVTKTGIEGSLVYAASALLRDEISAVGKAVIHLDLTPDWPLDHLTGLLSKPRGSRSISSYLQKRAGIKGVKRALLWEFLDKEIFNDPAELAKAIKALPVTLAGPRPLDEAISTAGGVVFEDLDPFLMIRTIPGVFCAGEMLDWEVPTGGYLLTACFASGRIAGLGALRWLSRTTA